jgi:hypothetical protein
VAPGEDRDNNVRAAMRPVVASATVSFARRDLDCRCRFPQARSRSRRYSDRFASLNTRLIPTHTAGNTIP